MSERAVLGAMILDNGCIEDVLARTNEQMFSKSGRQVYRAIMELHGKDVAVDLLTLSPHVEDAMFLAETTSSVPSSANVGYYVDLLRNTWIRTRMLTFSAKLNDMSGQNAEADEYLSALNNAISSIEDTGGASYSTALESVRSTFGHLEKVKANTNDYLGIPSGLTDLDEKTDGFMDGEFVIVGARPSQGKSALAMQFVLHSIGQGIPTAFFSLEMSKESLMMRGASVLSDVPLKKIRRWYLAGQDEKKVCEAFDKLSKSKLYVHDKANDDLYSVISGARMLVRREKVRMVVVDYLSLISVRSQAPRHEQVALVSRSLKALARDVNVPVIALSQLTRDTQGKRPTLNTIRESGAIEQDADVVLFLHEEESKPFEKEVIIAKQRNGPTGLIKVGWNPSTTKFENLERESFL